MVGHDHLLDHVFELRVVKLCPRELAEGRLDKVRVSSIDERPLGQVYRGTVRGREGLAELRVRRDLAGRANVRPAATRSPV